MKLTWEIFTILVPPKNLARLAELVLDGTISYTTAKYVLLEMVKSGIIPPYCLVKK